MSIELRDVVKQVGANIHIKETNLVLEAGHFNVLLGQTGAGKTSLIKLMAGLDKPASGQIVMNGVDVTKLSPQKRNISLVHQFFVNYSHMNVFDNIASPLRVVGMAKSEIEGRVEEVAKILQLSDMLQRRPNELSGGQQQRTALARAIVKESNAVFLDEPLANLDYKLREELREQLPELFASRGAVVVYATSEPEEALLLGGHTALIDDGYVTQFGPTSEIYHRPKDLASAKVFSNPPINVAQIVKKGGEMQMGNNLRWKPSDEIRKLPDGAYTLAVRPNHITPNKISENSIAISGNVQVTELSGSESSAHFVTGSNSWVSLTPGVHAFEVGSEHQFFMDLSHCLYFGSDGKIVAGGRGSRG